MLTESGRHTKGNSETAQGVLSREVAWLCMLPCSLLPSSWGTGVWEYFCATETDQILLPFQPGCKRARCVSANQQELSRIARTRLVLGTWTMTCAV